jgi:hypothetical protein
MTTTLAAHHAHMERRRRWALNAALCHAGALAHGPTDPSSLPAHEPITISQRDLLLALEAAFDHGCFDAAVYGRSAAPAPSAVANQHQATANAQPSPGATAGLIP